MNACYLVYKITITASIITLLITGQFFGMIATSFAVFIIAITFGKRVYKRERGRAFLFNTKAVVLWYMAAMLFLILQNI